MSVTIHFNDIIKKYNDKTVISGLSLDIKKGEFFTLLGPSGCGKTTLLRMVAGFNSIEGGEISFDEKVMNQITPQHRNIGMVFQNYAIFPNLNVKNNVAFGLKNRKISKDEIERRVDHILNVVQISQFKNSMPENLSGGQQQRIALARAIVIEPSVLLMDEPLSNLDAKLRIDMREAIKEIQSKVGITTVYVTHDQEEAMAVSDRIAVMNTGVIQQVGTPREIYQRPSNIFVASFIGRTNILERTLTQAEAKQVLMMDEGYQLDMSHLPSQKRDKVKVSIRPEEFTISQTQEGMAGVIQQSVFFGINVHYTVKLQTGEQVEVIQEATFREPLEPETKVKLLVKREKLNLFICRLKATGSFIRRYGDYCAEGKNLDFLIEASLKDDAGGDPMVTSDTLDMLGIMSKSEYEDVRTLTKQITTLVRDDLIAKGLTLYDIKLEFGRINGKVALIDEISSGCMRVYKDDKWVHTVELDKYFS
ncbi:phosphoribosylaminoimidazolesuccinocarboxamide synthase [Bacillus sp. SD088]|uniref:phosphoribosylaminoimidazolesuccinocarboxamide synthase n=1 Tax=Bacillus sp. SD088 TaxID=2782012 RepID=UPI001A97C284|nr:phosphoribosylaminoimidazolesuccinocarboxamide synthase [Bacillus sp. SD088]MBO0993543.1 ATP-binding cassette domain-containing protein [Bacillus sp. SD088]